MVAKKYKAFITYARRDGEAYVTSPCKVYTYSSKNRLVSVGTPGDGMRAVPFDHVFDSQEAAAAKAQALNLALYAGFRKRHHRFDAGALVVVTDAVADRWRRTYPELKAADLRAVKQVVSAIVLASRELTPGEAWDWFGCFVHSEPGSVYAWHPLMPGVLNAGNLIGFHRDTFVLKKTIPVKVRPKAKPWPTLGQLLTPEEQLLNRKGGHGQAS